MKSDDGLARSSLIAVWLVTALVSVLELDGQSADLLQQAGWHDEALIKTVVIGGAALDVVLGLLIWLKPSRLAYLAALAAMAVMTITATVLAPSLWLHPLGPLLKNLPIAAMLWQLARRNS